MTRCASAASSPRAASPPPEERRAFTTAEHAFWATIEAAAADGTPDRPASDAAPRGGPWDATIAHWEGAQICAAELSRMSLHDFAATALDGPNLILREGIGGLVARLADGLPIRTGARRRPPPLGRARRDRGGRLRQPPARAAIVTVSTGVLAAGGIAFDPPLPVATQEAIHALPIGLLTKIAFRADHPDAPDLPPFASLRRAVEQPGDRPMSWIARLFGDPVMIGFCGGDRAWEVAGDPARPKPRRAPRRAPSSAPAPPPRSAAPPSRDGPRTRCSAAPTATPCRARRPRGHAGHARSPTAGSASPARPAIRASPPPSPAPGSAAPRQRAPCRDQGRPASARQAGDPGTGAAPTRRTAPFTEAPAAGTSVG